MIGQAPYYHGGGITPPFRPPPTNSLPLRRHAHERTCAGPLLFIPSHPLQVYNPMQTTPSYTTTQQYLTKVNLWSY